jgi:chemotaxis protein CheD
MRGDGVTRAKVYLHAGQLHAAAEPCEITTILGSCVAVCLFDPVLRAAGANHYLLPLRVGTAHASPRFGNVAIVDLVERMLALGCRARDLRAKIFGGSTLTGGARIASQALGEQNIRLARETLAERGIPITAEDVGGDRGRKIVVRTDEGIVFVKKL